jgi:hypothetical protein
MHKLPLTLLILTGVFVCNCAGSSSTDPRCEGIDCSGHGKCVIESDQPRCLCDTGFREEGLACIEEAGGACDGVDCSGHGHCELSYDEAECVCDTGYYEDQLQCLADDQTGSWARTMASGGFDNGAADVAVDAAGNMFAIGSFESDADFNPSAGVDAFESQGKTDIFITRLNADWSYGWTKVLAGAGENHGLRIVVDSSDNLYLTGTFQDSVDLDPGPGQDLHQSAGNSDMFIEKLDSSGELVWNLVYSSSGIDFTRDLAIDAVGNVYLTGKIGMFDHPIDFDPSSTVHEIDPADVQSWVFITRINKDGTLGWVNFVDNSVSCDALSVHQDTLYLAGRVDTFSGTADMDPTDGEDITDRDGIYVTRLGLDGSYISSVITDVDSFSPDLGVDGSGNMIISGESNQATDFDPGSGEDLRSCDKYPAAYVFKLDTSGNCPWARIWCKTEDFVEFGVNRVQADAAGNVYTALHHDSAIDLDPTSGEQLSAKYGFTIVVLGPDGAFQKAWEVGSDTAVTSGFGAINGMVLDSQEKNLVAAGTSYSNGEDLDFDPSAGTEMHRYISKNNVFIWRLPLD